MTVLIAGVHGRTACIVARTLVAVLTHENTVGATLELWEGPTPIDEAVAAA